MDPYTGVWKEVGRGDFRGSIEIGVIVIENRVIVVFNGYVVSVIGMLHMLLDIFMLIIGCGRWIYRGDLLRKDYPRS